MEDYKKKFTSSALKLIEDAVKNILCAIDADPEREGLRETPHRVAKMFEEMFQGSMYTNNEIAELFNKCFDEPGAKDLVLIKNIDAFSYCEHHMALMYNMKVSVAYIPNGRVIGLSKVPRIVDLVCKRLQLQERIGTDVADILECILDTKDIMVVISGEHSCMTARGVQKPGTSTNTAVLRGAFDTDAVLRAEVYSLINSK